MKDYAIHYSYKGIGDVLIIIFDNQKEVTKHIRKGRVEVIYNNDEIIGYNIFDVKEIIKIKNEGKIFLPSPMLISVINTILKNEGLEELEEMKHSGFYTASIVDAIPIDEEKCFITTSLGDEYVSGIVKDNNLLVNEKIVVAKVGTRLSNGEIVKEGNMDGTLLNGHICTCEELNEPGTGVLKLDKDIEIGRDFFYMEEK